MGHRLAQVLGLIQIFRCSCIFHFANFGCIQVRAIKVCTGHIRVSKVGRSQLAFPQIRISEVGPAQRSKLHHHCQRNEGQV